MKIRAFIGGFISFLFKKHYLRKGLVNLVKTESENTFLLTTLIKRVSYLVQNDSDASVSLGFNPNPNYSEFLKIRKLSSILNSIEIYISKKEIDDLEKYAEDSKVVGYELFFIYWLLNTFLERIRSYRKLHSKLLELSEIHPLGSIKRDESEQKAKKIQDLIEGLPNVIEKSDWKQICNMDMVYVKLL